MLVRARRTAASLCIMLLALNVIACNTIRREQAQRAIQPGGSSVAMEKVVGVTLKSGSEIRFERIPTPFLRGDTLHAWHGGERLATPVSDLQRVWVKSVDKSRTALAVFGITALLFTLYIGIGFSGQRF